ncbi:MAG: type II toxin-antitoxin system HicB family antitoxin [Chloroflexia bacterium]|jgi:predicted RNase H-like HicB family nuclease|nr:type II toxin-antitoxin system HicB family antitoxin [Chloroflexia bacterium]
MLDAYIETAVQRKECEFLEGDGIFFCSVPGLRGVWSEGPTMEACVDELREVLVDWIQIRLDRGLTIPVLDGLELTVANVS